MKNEGRNHFAFTFGIFFTALTVCIVGALGMIAPAKTAFAYESAPSDPKEATIKKVLKEAGAEFGWTTGNCVSTEPAYEGADPQRYCPEIWGPRAGMDFSGENIEAVPGLAMYGLDVPIKLQGTVWETLPMKIQAFQTEAAAKAAIDEGIHFSKQYGGYNVTTFHGYPAISMQTSTLGGQTMDWQAGRLYFTAGLSIDAGISSAEIAEALYANAVKYGLIGEGGEVVEADDSDGDGVADDNDQCPGTPAGVAVDVTGCELPEQRITVATDKKIYSPGETVTIQGLVSNDAEKVKGIKVAVEVSKKEYSAKNSATTDANGNYNLTFPIPNDVKEATYEVTATAASLSLSDTTSFCVGEASIQLEQNDATGEQFVGVVADGASTLDITLLMPMCSEGCSDIKIAQPTVGTLEGDAVGMGGAVTLDAEGTAEIVYHPPEYLTKEQLTGKAKVHESGAEEWVAEVSLTVTYTDADGQNGTLESKILVSRPPVMLVHGFLGGEATWSKLSSYLEGEKFDAFLGDYGATGQSIEGLSLVLKQDIRKQKLAYTSANIKVEKVDIVGHSMGGLISRYYTNGLADYPGDVRKLIMVGTPNHGVPWSKKIIGNVGAGWYQTHSIPATQLYSESSFIKALNSSESTGAHLKSSIQYGNIYGFADDWVVSAASAYLNGVQSVTYSDVKHSPDIPGVPAVAITEYLNTWQKVNEWLTEDIYRPQLKGTHIEVYKATGNVFVTSSDASGQTETQVASTPTTIESWQGLRTDANSTAIVHLSIGDEPWGVIFLDPESEIVFGHLSPQLVEVRLWKGGAAFRSKEGGHFTVPVNVKKSENGEWWKYSPDAVVTGLNTEFAVTAGDNIQVHPLEGRLVVDTSESTETGGPLSAGESVAVDGESVTAIDAVSRDDFWWSDEDDDFLYPTTEDKKAFEFSVDGLKALGQDVKESLVASITFITAIVALLIFFLLAAIKFAKKKILMGIVLAVFGILFFCVLCGVTVFFAVDFDGGEGVATDVTTNENTNTAVNTNEATNADTTNTNTQTTTNSNTNTETIHTNTLSKTSTKKTSTVTVPEYGFSLDVGEEHAEKITPLSIDPGSFAEASYVFCYDTAEPFEDVIFCDVGEVQVFSVDIMTQKQWTETANAEYGSNYSSIGERNGLFYIFSHTSDPLPGDVPATDTFYNKVMDSIEFSQ